MDSRTITRGSLFAAAGRRDLPRGWAIPGGRSSGGLAIERSSGRCTLDCGALALPSDPCASLCAVRSGSRICLEIRSARPVAVASAPSRYQSSPTIWQRFAREQHGKSFSFASPCLSRRDRPLRIYRNIRGADARSTGVRISPRKIVPVGTNDGDRRSTACRCAHEMPRWDVPQSWPSPGSGGPGAAQGGDPGSGTVSYRLPDSARSD
jgi:hypothetical protein